MNLPAPLSDPSSAPESKSPLHRAERTLETIGQLAAGIVHEVNTPAQFVADNLYFLQRTTPGVLSALRSTLALVDAVKRTGEHAELVRQVESEIARLKLDYVTTEIPKALAQSQEGLTQIAAIVHSMKLFSRRDSTDLDQVDLADAVQACITLTRNEWKYVARVETDFQDPLPQVPCRREQIHQVIVNLIVNASHAIKAKQQQEGTSGVTGTIGVRLRREGDSVQMTVWDDGTGIPEEFRDRIFQPFFTTKPTGVGTGQGLAIAWTVVVDHHGGHIDFESQVGEGTQFHIYLPLVPTDSEEE